MAKKRKIEVFSAGCSACEETIALVNRIACPSCAVEVLDMRRAEVAERANRYGIRRVPAVVVNGQLADCCRDQGVTESDLRAAGVGQRQAEQMGVWTQISLHTHPSIIVRKPATPNETASHLLAKHLTPEPSLRANTLAVQT